MVFPQFFFRDVFHSVLFFGVLVLSVCTIWQAPCNLLNLTYFTYQVHLTILRALRYVLASIQTHFPRLVERFFAVFSFQILLAFILTTCFTAVLAGLEHFVFHVYPSHVMNDTTRAFIIFIINFTFLPIPVAARLRGLRVRIPPGASMYVLRMLCVVR
jgi:hypothetical protein